MTRIFLSYARSDDEPFVRRLHTDLTAAGFTVWFDRESLMSRGLTFHQEIKDAIRTEVDRVIYIAGPKATISQYVREEWHFALECDHVVVMPILRLGDYDNVPGELSLLHCEDFRDDANYDSALAKLIGNLWLPNPPLGGLFAVPSLPANFLGRPELMRRVRDALLIDLQKPHVITSADARVGMQGMGGIGKSVLAAALARNREIRHSYPDGILWVSCGQNLTRDDLLKRQRDVARHLGGDDRFESLPQGQGILRQLFSAKAALLVLDDVWQAADAEAFDVLGPRCRMLVTTRDAGILHALHGELVPVSLFTETEAMQLLADVVGSEPAALTGEAREVVRKCGLLPLAVALCGGMAKKRKGDFHSVLERLRRADLDKISDRESINEQHHSIWRAMRVSVDVLPPEEQRRFIELAVFATDRIVPEAAVLTLWTHTGNLDDLDTEDLLINLAERSLIQLDEKVEADGRICRRLSLHDLLHDFVIRLSGDRKALHQILLDAYLKQCPEGWHSGPNDGYFLQSICHHLGEAGNEGERVELLCDLRFVEARCRTGQVFDFQADYRAMLDVLPENQENILKAYNRASDLQSWIEGMIVYAQYWNDRRDSLDYSEQFLESEPQMPQLRPSSLILTDEEIISEWRRLIERPSRLDKLKAFADFVQRECYPLHNFSHIEKFVLQHALNASPVGPVHAAAEDLLPKDNDEPFLIRHWPVDATINQEPKLLRELYGHINTISNVCISPDGKMAVSLGSGMFVWNLENGQRLRGINLYRIPSGSGPELDQLTISYDCRKIVGVGYGGLLVGDLEDDPCCLHPLGIGRNIVCVSITPDGRRAVSGSDDRPKSPSGWSHAKMFDLYFNPGLGCYPGTGGHSYDIMFPFFLNALMVWDLNSGDCLRTLLGHSKPVLSVSITPDGRKAASGSDDKTVRVWDLESGYCIRIFSGHTNSVKCVRISPDGQQVVSVSSDNTLRVWRVESGECITYETNNISISCLFVTADGNRAITLNDNNTLKIWNLKSGECLLTFMRYNITCIGITPDGRKAITGSEDNNVKVWDLANIQIEQRFNQQSHSQRVRSVCITPDGRKMVSGGDDNDLRIWDLKGGKCLHTLKGHTGWVFNVCITADGSKIVSGSFDSTLRVWDLNSGQCLFILEGHSGWIWALKVTHDSRRAISGSFDNTLRVWDLENGQCLHTLEGNYDAVRCLDVTSDGRWVISGGGDNSVRDWDLMNGQRHHILYGDEGNSTIGLRKPDQVQDLPSINKHLQAVQCINVTPNNRWVISGSDDNSIRVWDIESGKCLHTLVAHHGERRSSRGISRMALTSDGRRVISADNGEGTIRVWNLENGQCEHTLVGRGKNRLAFSQKGRWLISGSNDKALRVWDLKNGQNVALYVAQSPIDSIAISACGESICIGTENGEVIILDTKGFETS